MGFFEQRPTWNSIYCWESFIICLGQWKCMLCFWARFHLVACTSNLLLKPHSDLPQHVSGTVARSRVMCHDTWRSCFCTSTSFLGWTPVSAWIRLWPGAATAFSCCLPPLCLECLPSQDGNCCSFPELSILRALLMVLLWHCSVVHLAPEQTALSLIRGEGSCLLEEERTDLVPPGCLLHKDQLSIV